MKLREILELAKNRYPTSKESRYAVNTERRAWRLKNQKRYLLNAAKERAARHDVPFRLLESDIVVPDVCPVLGCRLEMSEVGLGAQDCSPSLDRIENQLGYVRGNVWVISWRANRLKSDATLEEMKKLVQALEQASRRSS